MKIRYLAFAFLALAGGTVQAGGAQRTKTKIITLECVTSTGLAYPVEIDEFRNVVRVDSTSAKKVLIDKNHVSFDVDLAGTTYTYQLSRLSGTANVSTGDNTPMSHTCKPAAPIF